MIILQKFGFKESRYERPQDAWVCGHLADGKPCELGPGPNGRCRVTTVCQPRLENDRWQCRRSANAGGPCQAGPLPDGQCCMAQEPCVPRRSLRARRQRSTLAAVALMVGVLAVFLGGEGGRHFMMPGKLSAPHAGLTDCSTCHAGARSGQLDLMHRLFTAVEPRQNSNLCVTCHVMGADPFTPHTHPVEDLRRLTDKLRSDSKSWPAPSLMQRIAFPSAARSTGAEAEIQCATCHKEHDGVFVNLEAVSNQRCQTCHVSRFGSFADSHPQFVKFPYQRRPRIIFNHQSHISKHFPDAVKAAIAGQVAPESCADCHQTGVRKRYMMVKPFDTTCASCHNGDINGATQVSGPKGIDVIAIPGLDLVTLSEHGIDIGGWPKESEAVLTPFMRLLLESRGEGVVSAVAGVNLLDLSKASDQDLARVAALAWAVKHLFNQLETTSPAAARALAGKDSAKQVNSLQMAALAGGMSHDVIVAANHEWFPDLQDDLQRHDRGDPTRDFKPPTKPTANAAKPSNPAVGGGNATATTKTPGAALSNDILAPKGKAGAKKEDILTPSKKEDILTPGNNDDILAPNNKDAILAPGNKDDILSGDKPGADDILSGGGGDTVLGGAASQKVDTSTSAGAKKSADAAPAPFDPETWGENGGWYREDFTIRYRPTGHADQFLQSWLEYTGRSYSGGLHDQLTPIFDELAPQDAVGRCTKCHSVDDEAGAKIVNWRPFDPNSINNRFTNYSHKPHVELIGTKSCVNCHELQETESGFLKTYEKGDPANYTPNFKPLEKSVCAACHSQQTAWESCTLCHGYHVPAVNSSSPVPAVPVAFDKSTVPAPADKSVAVVPDISALATPDKSVAVAPDNSAPLVPDQPAAVAPDNSASATPAQSASAGTGEPADLDGVFRRGLQRAFKGDFDLAIADFSEVIRRDPSHAAALNNRCWALAMLDEVEAALKDCDASLRVAPAFGDAFDSRGLINLKLGLYKKAISDYSTALSYNFKRASALYGRGIAKQRIGNAAGAKVDIDAAKRIQPAIAGEFAGYGIR
jgi:Flp pilus assembly protein TadD